MARDGRGRVIPESLIEEAFGFVGVNEKTLGEMRDYIDTLIKWHGKDAILKMNNTADVEAMVNYDIIPPDMPVRGR